MMSQLLRLERNGNSVIAFLSGRIDSAVAKEFEQSIVSLLDGGEKSLIIDFSSLDYISSAGLRVLLFAAKRLKANQGFFAIAALKPSILEVFQVSGFATILNLYSTTADAIAAIN